MSCRWQGCACSSTRVSIRVCIADLLISDFVYYYSVLRFHSLLVACRRIYGVTAIGRFSASFATNLACERLSCSTCLLANASSKSWHGELCHPVSLHP